MTAPYPTPDGLEEVPPGFCPKCIGPRADDVLACPLCGLALGNFDPAELAPSRVLASTWLQLRERWEDISLHDRLLKQASVMGELAAIARLYRIRLAKTPDDPIALRGKEEALRLAGSLGSWVPDEPLPSRKKVVATSLVAALAILATVAWLTRACAPRHQVTRGTVAISGVAW